MCVVFWFSVAGSIETFRTGYTFSSPNIEYYMGKNTKDAYGCKGSGGTACAVCNDKSKYGWRMRIWTIE